MEKVRYDIINHLVSVFISFRSSKKNFQSTIQINFGRCTLKEALIVHSLPVQKGGNKEQFSEISKNWIVGDLHCRGP
jgi:hypothetical protein